MPLDATRGGSHVGPQLCAAGTLEVGSDRAVPRWVNIVPLPPGATTATIAARDGRKFVIEDAAALVAESNAELARQKGPHPVDKDHQMHSWWSGGGPALGWAERYELREDGIYAETDWLPEGQHLIGNKLYRYTSCNVYCERVNVKRDFDEWGWPTETYDLKMLRFAGYTLTNIPALETHSLGLELHAMKIEILKKLGLTETATPEDAMRAIDRLAASGSQVDLSRYVPRADHDAIVQKLAAATTELDNLKSASVKAEHDRLIADALSKGKITPASEAEYREYLKATGPEAFQRLMATLPELGGRVDATRKPPLGADDNTLTPAEEKALAQSGLTREEYLAARAERRKSRAA